MEDPSVADQVTRLKLKLLEKKLEAERENMEENLEPSLAMPRSYEEDEIVQSALRRRKDLLHKLRGALNSSVKGRELTGQVGRQFPNRSNEALTKEQHLLEELAGPYPWGGSPRRSYRAEGPPAPIYPSQPEQPRIIQQTVPQPPTTIIQQLPQPPLITQIPPAPAYAGPRSGSIKEDMVEMMLMQNAQMHQIIMQNMMLKVLPPGTPDAGPPWLRPAQQEPQCLLRAEKPRTSSVHHHHHYGPPGLPALPAPGPPVGYPLWPSLLPAPAVTQAPGPQPAIRHMMGPTTTVPALNMSL